MVHIRTYIVTYAYITKSGSIQCYYDSAHATSQEAHARKEEIEEMLQQKRDVVKYDVDIVGAILRHDQYTMGVE